MDEIRAISDAAVYWDTLARLTPLALFGGVVAMILNLMRAVRCRKWLCRIILCLYVFCVGCISAMVAALGISLFVPRPTPEIELLAAAVAGSSGQKIFDIYAWRIFGSYMGDRRGNPGSQGDEPPRG